MYSHLLKKLTEIKDTVTGSLIASSIIFRANTLFLFLSILFLATGSKLQSENLILGILLNEYVFILAPVIMFMVASGMDIRRSLRLNRIDANSIIYTVLIIVLLYPFIATINLLLSGSFTDLLPFFNTVYAVPSVAEFILYIFVLALTPAICEEILFRGLLFHVYSEKRPVVNYLLTSVLFGMMHFNLQNTLAPMLLGLVLTYLSDRTRSIIPAVIGHLTYNFISLLLVLLATSLNLQLIRYIPQKDIPVYSFMGIIVIALCTYGAYKIYDLIESKHKLGLRRIIDSSEIWGQISIDDYFGSSFDGKFKSSNVNTLFEWVPLVIFVIIYILSLLI